jgi:DNA-directed RNA polymerase specialized sigma24 family protein
MDELFSASVWRTLASRRGGREKRVTRANRKPRWSPEDAAAELHRRRAELIAQLRRRSESRGIPAAAQEEIVDDATTAVVMSARGVANEHHLIGAFWLAVDHRCRRHREGRHSTRLGSRLRVEFDAAAEQIAAGPNPFDRVALRDRLARAADLMADLDPKERQVVSVMAAYGVGPVSAARLLGVPLGEIRAAARSANVKLDRVAAISAAGRMCQFRARAIAADAGGVATERDAKLARAHVSACVPCGRVYRELRREMRGREFQRAATAAFLPLPAMSAMHVGAVGKVAVWIEQRLHVFPRGSGERTAELLGGAGIAKAAAAGTAIVVAGGALTGHLVHAVEGTKAPTHRRHAHVARRIETRASAASTTSAHVVEPTAPRSAHAARHRHAAGTPPSKSLGYLALGGSSGGGSAPTEPATAGSVRATAASVPAPSTESSPTVTQSGGGTNLSYLGK